MIGLPEPIPADAYRLPRPPEKVHTDKHASRGDVEFETCWRCARDRANCASKIRLNDPIEAMAWARDFNESHGYASAVVPYRCGWCLFWHMRTARGKHALRRVEEWRRKWAVAQTKQARPPLTFNLGDVLKEARRTR